MTYKEFIDAYKIELERDFEQCVEWAFKQLDNHRNGLISVQALKIALHDIMKHDQKSEIKLVRGQMLRHLNDDISIKANYTFNDFHIFIHRSLKQFERQ